MIPLKPLLDVLEVEEQLRKMLAAPRFRNAPRPSAFLELTVKRALRGEKTPGRVVAEIFGERFIQGACDDVRVTANHLRKTLKRYYEGEGKSDVVIIEYPEPSLDRTIKPVEGEAYTPGFSYNPEHYIYVFLRLAYGCLRRGTIPDCYNALKLFASIIEDKPDDVNGLLGIAETLCIFVKSGWRMRWEDWNLNETLAKKIFRCTLKQLNEGTSEFALKDQCDDIFSLLKNRANGYWRYWAVRAQFCLDQEWMTPAAMYYGAALRLDRTATEGYVPYIEFLIQKGDLDMAVVLARRYFLERVDDSYAVAEYGHLVCKLGFREEGIRYLQGAINIDQYNWRAYAVLAVMRLTQRETVRLGHNLSEIKRLTDSETFGWFVGTLKPHEKDFQLEGTVARLVLELPSASSEAIAKR